MLALELRDITNMLMLVLRDNSIKLLLVLRDVNSIDVRIKGHQYLLMLYLRDHKQTNSLYL